MGLRRKKEKNENSESMKKCERTRSGIEWPRDQRGRGDGGGGGSIMNFT